MEPNVLGELPSSAGATGNDPEARGQRGAAAWNSNCRRSRSPRSRQTVFGADSGADLPWRLLRISSWPLGDRRRPNGTPALLAARLGARHRREKLLRQHRLGVAAQGGPQTYGLSVGVALHRTLAEGAGENGGRKRRSAYVRNSARWGRKPNLGESVPTLCV